MFHENGLFYGYGKLINNEFTDEGIIIFLRSIIFLNGNQIIRDNGKMAFRMVMENYILTKWVKRRIC